MQLHGIELVIWVKNRAIQNYQHNNQSFVEGRADSNYEIEVRNHTYARVEAVISVDGLSIIDGKEAGNSSQGYLINARSNVRIPGWKLDFNNVAKFAFAGKQDSYATQMSSGKTLNNGVIGVMVFNEKLPIFQFQTSWPTSINQRYDTSLSDRASWSGSAASGSADAFGVNKMSNSISSAASNTISSSAAVPQSLGTAFGAATGFATQIVAFTRGEMLTILSLFYDSLSGLRAKGVPVQRHRERTKPHQPNAFPNMTGCSPPTNWQG